MLLRCSAEIPVVRPCRVSTETVNAVPSGASFIATIGARCSRRASSIVKGAQTMPQHSRMTNAIFSGVHSDAARTRSPSFSRSSSSVTTTISPRAMASIAWVTGCGMSFPLSIGGASARKSLGVTAPRVSTTMRSAVSREKPRAGLAADLGHRAGRQPDSARELPALDAVAEQPISELHGRVDRERGALAQLNLFWLFAPAKGVSRVVARRARSASPASCRNCRRAADRPAPGARFPAPPARFRDNAAGRTLHSRRVRAAPSARAPCAPG